MPDHVPELCPECGSPLGPQETKCWKCGHQIDHEAAQAEIRRAEAPSASSSPPAGGTATERPKLIDRLRSVLRRSS